jgi:hypothetical protein
MLFERQIVEVSQQTSWPSLFDVHSCKIEFREGSSIRLT